MVPFAGYEMPVQYPAGILKEHLHTRAKAGLFDVSHMGQAFLVGARSGRGAGTLTPADVAGPEGRHAALWAAAERRGHHQGRFHGLAPGGRGARCISSSMPRTKEDDFAYIAEKLKGVATLTPQPDRALLALQGPWRRSVLERHAPGIAALTFMKVDARRLSPARPPSSAAPATRAKTVSRFRSQANDAERVARALLAEAEVLPIGLGARDSLRLEAGLCLYGHDIDETIDPVDANLVWSIGKRRKTRRDFPAPTAIMDKLLERHGARSASASGPTARRPRAKARRSPTRPAASSARSPAAASGRA